MLNLLLGSMQIRIYMKFTFFFFYVSIEKQSESIEDYREVDQLSVLEEQ